MVWLGVFPCLCSRAPTCRPRTRGFSALLSIARHLGRAKSGTFPRRTACGPCKLRSGRGPESCSGRARNPISVLSLRNACTPSVRSPPSLRTVCIVVLCRTRSRRKVSLGCSFGKFFWVSMCAAQDRISRTPISVHCRSPPQHSWCCKRCICDPDGRTHGIAALSCCPCGHRIRLRPFLPRKPRKSSSEAGKVCRTTAAVLLIWDCAAVV
jgi:hypothetical protein